LPARTPPSPPLAQAAVPARQRTTNSFLTMRGLPTL
jgi:hypothetical protein